MNFSDLHERLRLEILRRIDRGVLTGSLLARQTGFEPAHISNFLHRKRMLSLRALDEVLKAQKLTVADLFPESQLARRLEHDGTHGAEYESVPLTTQAAAVHDSRIPPHSVLQLVKVRASFLQDLREKCSVGRRTWQRFVAVQVTERQAHPMKPVILAKTVLLIDRHYNSLVPYHPDRLTIYAVRFGNLLRFRYVEQAANHLVLRPHSLSYPVELIELSASQNIADLLIGRICLSITEL